MQAQTPPYASEVILYRTRTDILSDLRFIVDGETYPLQKIQAARVVPAAYYIPFQAVRALALLAALFFLVSLTGAAGEDVLPESVLARLVTAALLGGAAFLAGRVIPTHRIRLRMDKRSVTVMLSHNKDDLKAIAAKINQAAARLQKAAEDKNGAR